MTELFLRHAGDAQANFVALLAALPSFRVAADTDGVKLLAREAGWLAVGLRQIETACALFEEALSLDPSDPDLWLAYASVLELAGRVADAVAAFEACERTSAATHSDAGRQAQMSLIRLRGR